MKNALAQIAASTIAHTNGAVEERVSTARPDAARPDAARVDAAQSPVERPAVAPAEAEAKAEAEAEAKAVAEADVAILDIPIKKTARAPRKISTQDAEQILDSVLDALPEPKQPGQGRSRTSRRASSSGTVRTSPSESAPISHGD